MFLTFSRSPPWQHVVLILSVRKSRDGDEGNGTIVNDGRVLEKGEWRPMRAPGEGKGEGRPWYAR